MDAAIVRDFLPIPDTVAPVTDPEHKEVAHSITQSPTDKREEKGAAQEGHDAEVLDLGWNRHPDEVAKPLIAGLENEELWLLIRRFNKQMYHKLDLNIADEEEFSPDKLRANLERLYVTVGLSVISIVKHVARLRSWRELDAQAFFVYLLVWLLDLLVPHWSLWLSSSLSIHLREREAAEAEAAHLVTSLASLAIASASGKHPQSEAPMTVPSTTSYRILPRSQGKVPMETAVWTMFRPILHGIGDVTDTYERFANVLSPTPRFPPPYRLRLAALLVPFLFISIPSPLDWIRFFGDPIIRIGVRRLNRTIPHWEKLLELRKVCLRTLNSHHITSDWRINKAALPPPPVSEYPPPDEPVELSDIFCELPVQNPTERYRRRTRCAYSPIPCRHHTGDEQIDHAKGKSGGKASKIVNLVKKGIRGTVHTALGADLLKAKAGSETAKRRIGVLPRHREMTGPVDFACRYEGKKGHAYISTKATIPCIAFSLDGKISSLGSSARAESDLNPIWSIAVGDIKEIRKLGGFGWKAKLVVGWALDREIADGLEIVTKRGEVVSLTAMVLRDELFNRLVAMGGQKWEAW
ncbi:hypothetical protein B0H13DRAFT_2457498 [Mycena leptocephala]|nr:hypothetical protein B0H13DRAFT_2457498 [Mycena leptocephala]